MAHKNDQVEIQSGAEMDLCLSGASLRASINCRLHKRISECNI